MALPRRNRLAAKGDIDEVFKLGKAARGSFLLIKYTVKDASGAKIAAVVPTSVAKNAVDRNRIRRVVLEAIRTQLDFLQEGCRIVLIAQKGIISEDRASISGEVVFLLRKTKLNNHE